MTFNVKTNTVVKSFVMAGVLSVGVFAGGHIGAAAGQGNQAANVTKVNTVKVEQTSDFKAVRVKASETAKTAPQVETGDKETVKTDVQVEDQTKVAAKEEKVNPSSTNKANSMANERASKNAQLHAASNSAVQATVEEDKAEEVTEDVATADSTSEKSTDLDTNVKAKTEDNDSEEEATDL
ncbi:MAG: hypothetical protein ACQEWV_21165, partial [Bacillota bacterium]